MYQVQTIKYTTFDHSIIELHKEVSLSWDVQHLTISLQRKLQNNGNNKILLTAYYKILFKILANTSIRHLKTSFIHNMFVTVFCTFINLKRGCHGWMGMMDLSAHLGKMSAVIEWEIFRCKVATDKFLLDFFFFLLVCQKQLKSRVILYGYSIQNVFRFTPNFLQVITLLPLHQ